MKKFAGKPVCTGIVLGPAAVLRKQAAEVRRRQTEDVRTEAERLERAVAQACGQLQELYEKALEETGESGAAVFEAHRMMLEDEAFLGSIRSMIRSEKADAAYAVAVTGDRFAKAFAGAEDEYLRARAEDVRDVSERLIRVLEGAGEPEPFPKKPSVIVAEDLSPGETIRMGKENILGIVTVRGSVNSHAAILARMMDIPALTGVSVDLNGIRTGEPVMLDACEGHVIFEPDGELCAQAERKMEEEQEKRRLLETFKGKKSVTADGRRIRLCANVGSAADVGRAVENDAEGIGLFRSEFLYLGRDCFPTEEEQFQTYRQAAQAMVGKKVVIRTLDIGADKQADYFGLEKEANPALGYRAIRICLKQPDIFRTQLRALLRAAVYGDIAVMYPMIISTEEVRQIRGIVETVKARLDAEGVPCRMPEQGIMIETPAAVMISDELAEMVDFFSIGTNDLTQYTLAADRQNGKLADFYDPHHKAVLRMIRMAAENAHRCGKWVGICGELAADVSLTEEFVRMGIDELSVAPSMVLMVRKAVQEAVHCQKTPLGR